MCAEPLRSLTPRSTSRPFDRRRRLAQETLNALTSGVYLALDRFGHIIFMKNHRLDHQVKTSNALRIQNHRLEPADQMTRATMSKAIAEAVTPKKRPWSTRGVTVALPDGKGAG